MISHFSVKRFNYEQYKENCLEAGDPLLTKREWKMEGELTYAESKQRSLDYHRRKRGEEYSSMC